MELGPSEPRFRADDEEVEPAVNRTATANTLNLDDNVVLRLLAVALARVQRHRQRPKKKGHLHRV